MIWQFLDIFFVVFHTSLIFFNLLGWIWSKTRKINLVVLLLTGSSWLFIGMIVGTLGYCPLTDWHFSILNKLGVTDLPSSYIKYLADRLTGMDIRTSLVDNITLYSFILALGFSLLFNVMDLIRSKGLRRLN